jgi:hypothetical protein
MQRKRIVGPGRNAGDRHSAAFSHDRPVSGVAAKDEDDRNSGGTHQSSSATRIFDRPGDRHLQERQARETRLAAAARMFDAAHDVRAYAAYVRHHHHIGNAGSGERGERAIRPTRKSSAISIL